MFRFKPSRITLVELSIINTSYQKLPSGSGDYPDKLLFHQALFLGTLISTCFIGRFFSNPILKRFALFAPIILPFRAWAESGWLPKAFHPQQLWFSLDWLLSGPQQRPTPRLWGAAVVEISRNLGTPNETSNTPQRNACPSLAGSYSSASKITIAREMERRFWWGGCVRAATAAVGSQKRLTRCFREVEVASQQQKKKTLKNCKNISFHARGPTVVLIVRWLHHRWKHGLHQKLSVLQADILNNVETFAKKTAETKIMFPWEVVKLLDLKRGKKRLKSSRFLFLCSLFFRNFEIRISCATSAYTLFPRRHKFWRTAY